MSRLSSQSVNTLRRGLVLGGAIMLGYTQSRGQTQPALNDIVSIKDKTFAGGAPSTGASSAVPAFKSAVATIPSDTGIYLPTGIYLLDASVSLNGKNLTFFGPGVIQTTTSSGAFTRSDHGPFTCFRGTRFIGSGDAIKFIAPPTQTMFVEYLFDGCRFDNAGWGVYLDGMREGVVTNCSFDSGKGAYRVRTVNTDFVACNWKNTQYGVNDDGDRSPFSAGLKVIGGNMIGVGTGVRSVTTDLVTIIGTTIDYCDKPVELLGVDGAIISGAYITSRTVAPALTIDWDPASKDVCRAVKVNDCPALLQHFIGAGADSVYIAHSDDTTLRGNNINFWQRYGIFHTNNVRMTIEDNTIDPMGGAGVNSIKSGAADDSSNVARHNKVSKPISVEFMQLDGNLGHISRAQGVSSISSGTNVINVTHGLPFTPNLNEISITPGNPAFANARFWVDSANATSFTVATSAPVSGAATFGWTVEKAVTI